MFKTAPQIRENMTTQGPQKGSKILKNGPWKVQVELLSFTLDPQGVPGGSQGRPRDNFERIWGHFRTIVRTFFEHVQCGSNVLCGVCLGVVWGLMWALRETKTNQ